VKARQDCAQYTLKIGQYIGIPEAQNPVSLDVYESVAATVCKVLGVLTAVHFDHELSFTADKIGDVWLDGFLADELEAAQSPVSQREP
jgi:hypothetical protein